MAKYVIEENINFYEELNKSMNNNDIIENFCLITNNPLENNHVTLECGHSFNYLPLCYQIFSQKFGLSNFKDIKQINIRENIECPYCRQVQPKLISYLPEENFKLAYGIHSNDVNHKILLHNNEFVYANTIMYSLGKCHFIENDCICPNLNVLQFAPLNQTFCHKHYNKSKKLYYKNQKIVEKENSKKQKLIMKDQMKEQMKKEKKEICNCILKSGKNKGTQCRNKVFQENVCKRHLPIH
jgi:hypothetical protein